MKRILLILIFTITTANAQWSNQNAGFTNKVLGFYEFSIVNENTVWAICYDGFNGLLSTNPVLDFTRTIDGGTTWISGTMGTDTTLAFSNISAISDTEAWVAMHRFGSIDGGGGGIFHTIDSGVTWTQSNANTIFNSASFPNFVHFKDAMNGIAGGNVNDGYFEIYKTSDGGTTWTRTPQANFPALPLNVTVGWFNGYCVIGNTIWFGSNRGKMYKSIDYGTTWTIANVSTNTNDRVYEIAFNNNGLNGVCHTRSGSTTKLFATSDGGMTWVQRVTATIPNWRRDRITSVPGTNSFISTSTSAQMGSAISNDNGLTWTLLESANQKAACRFLNSTTGWAGGFFSDNPQIGNRPGIYKWDNSVNLGFESNELLEKKIVVYPNPAKENLTISFPKELNQNLKIEIIDLLGRISFSEEYDNQLNNEIKINISNLAKGNYLLKIFSDNEFVTKKINIQ
jgi:photosystem II stability/assembly factor-like uncharacterized protein